MEYSFKKFEKTNQRFEDRITVTASHSFGLPTRFFKENQIDKFKYVILFYDETKKAVGLHFTNSEEEEHKFTILKSKMGLGGAIIASSFFKNYKLDPKRYKGRYQWRKQELQGVGTLFIIELKERGRLW